MYSEPPPSRHELCMLSPALKVSAEVGLGDIMARGRPDCPVIQQNRRLRMLKAALES